MPARSWQRLGELSSKKTVLFHAIERENGAGEMQTANITQRRNHAQTPIQQ
jgi:hypothetical protein